MEPRLNFYKSSLAAMKAMSGFEQQIVRSGWSKSFVELANTQQWHIHIVEWLAMSFTKAFSMHRVFQAVVAFACASASLSYAQALHMGFMQLPQADGGQTTVFYPTLAAGVPVKKGPFNITLAGDAAPVRGNSRLIVLSIDYYP